ncbi:MAG: hydrogenase maturation protease [Nitriliruptoraceae bacterium]
MTCLVLGVGHPDRGDDAAGHLVASALAEAPGVVVRQVTGDPSGILTDPLWDRAERVVLVDTVRTGRRPGTVHRWAGERLLAHLPDTGGGTHDLGVATTLQLAAALERLPEDLVVIGIEGSSFQLGAPPSRPVRHAIAMVSAALARELCGDDQPRLGLALRMTDLAAELPQDRKVRLEQP